MKILAPKWTGCAVVLMTAFSGLGLSRAEAQGFGLSYNSPGLSIGINQPAYYGGGFYPAPVVVPRPLVVAPPVIYGARPFYGYGGGYGYRGGYPHPGYYGGSRGGPGPYGRRY